MNVRIAKIQPANIFNLLFLDAFTSPIIILNNNTLKSGEPLQINCSAVKLDKTSSFLYEIQVNGTTVAKENNSFVHTIESVKSTDAGNYTCKISSIALPAHIVGVSNEVTLSGKSTFSLVDFLYMSDMEVFFFVIFRIVKFLRDGNFDLERANLFQSGFVFYIETIYLNCIANQMAGFYKKRNTGLKWVNQTVLKLSYQLSYRVLWTREIYLVKLPQVKFIANCTRNHAITG